MKKIILTVATVFVLSFANAQDKKASGFGFSEGDVFVEGNISSMSSNNKNSDTKTSSFEFNPKAGYFLSDKFAVGVELGIGSGKTTVAGTNTSKSSNFNFGAFGRYYFLDLGQRFKTYTEFGFNVGSDKTGVSTTVKTNTFDLGAGLGMNYFVTPKVAISFGLGNVINFGSSKTDMTGDKGSSSMDLNLNVFNNFFTTPTFGALYKF
jgi:outer membrane protein